ncbi:MAG: DUF924 family protein [Rubrivivax sp.]
MTAAGEPVPTPEDVLGFWFGPAPWAERVEWFRKDPAFDDTIRSRFGTLVERALDGPLGWDRDPRGTLAELIVLDQFPRNLFRGDARAFAGDARARTLAAALVDRALDQALPPHGRWFAYLPFEHAEDLALQDRSVALFERLRHDAPEAASPTVLDYAQRHRDVIQRFGRFPHRNAALGRVSSADEAAYLATPGSGF